MSSLDSDDERELEREKKQVVSCLWWADEVAVTKTVTSFGDLGLELRKCDLRQPLRRETRDRVTAKNDSLKNRTTALAMLSTVSSGRDFSFILSSTLPQEHETWLTDHTLNQYYLYREEFIAAA